MDIQRRGTTARYSDSVTHQGVVYTVEVPGDETGITAQSRSVLAGIERLLIEAGSHPRLLLQATVYLTDMADYAAFNAVWDAWVPPGCAPARVCVQVVALAQPQWRVEVAVVAGVSQPVAG